MVRLLRAAAFLALTCSALPLLAADKKTDLKAPLDKQVNTAKSLAAGQLTGKVVAVVESKKSLRLRLTLQTVELNTGAYNNMVNAQLQLARAQASRDINGIAGAAQTIAQN